MKKYYLLLLISTCSFYFTSAQYTWTRKANFGPTVRAGAISFTIGGKGYAGTGSDSAAVIKKDFWQYDTLTNAWTQIADYGGGTTFNAVAFAIGNKGYAGLGSAAYPSYNFVKDWWEYDPATNVWTQKGNFPGAGRYTPAYFVIGNKGYLGTGWSPLMSDWWEYDPATDTWTQKTDFAGGLRQSTVSFSIGNKGYVGAGAYSSTIYNDFWEYDPATDVWTRKADIPGVRNNAASFTIGGYGFVGLGSVTYPTLSFLKDFYRYDPSTDAWTRVTDFAGSARYAAITFSFNGSCSAYLGTGVYGPNVPQTFTNDLWRFSIDSCNAVTTLPPVASFQSGDTILCANDCANFTNLSTNTTSWQWSFAGGIPSSSTSQNPHVCYDTAGTFNVKLVVYNSGGKDSVTFTNYIHVKPTPPIPLITQHHDTLCCNTNPSYTSYQWYDSTAIITGATDTSIIITHGGQYGVEVKSENGCKIAGGIHVALDGIKDYQSDHFFSLSPNPATNQLTIHTSSLRNQAATFSIINVLGQETSPPTPLSEERGVATIDVSKLAAGMYFLEMKTESGSVVKRFVKE